MPVTGLHIGVSGHEPDHFRKISLFFDEIEDIVLIRNTYRVDFY